MMTSHPRGTGLAPVAPKRPKPKPKQSQRSKRKKRDVGVSFFLPGSRLHPTPFIIRLPRDRVEKNLSYSVSQADRQPALEEALVENVNHRWNLTSVASSEKSTILKSHYSYSNHVCGEWHTTVPAKVIGNWVYNLPQQPGALKCDVPPPIFPFSYFPHFRHFPFSAISSFKFTFLNISPKICFYVCCLFSFFLAMGKTPLSNSSIHLKKKNRKNAPRSTKSLHDVISPTRDSPSCRPLFFLIFFFYHSWHLLSRDQLKDDIFS